MSLTIQSESVPEVDTVSSAQADERHVALQRRRPIGEHVRPPRGDMPESIGELSRTVSAVQQKR